MDSVRTVTHLWKDILENSRKSVNKDTAVWYLSSTLVWRFLYVCVLFFLCILWLRVRLEHLSAERTCHLRPGHEDTTLRLRPQRWQSGGFERVRGGNLHFLPPLSVQVFSEGELSAVGLYYVLQLHALQISHDCPLTPYSIAPYLENGSFIGDFYSNSPSLAHGWFIRLWLCAVKGTWG